MPVPRATGPAMAPAVQPVFGTDDPVIAHVAPDDFKRDTQGTKHQRRPAPTWRANAKPLIHPEIDARPQKAVGTETADLDRLFARLGHGRDITDFDRNGRHDLCHIRKIETRAGHAMVFDVLCLPHGHDIHRAPTRFATLGQAAQTAKSLGQRGKRHQTTPPQMPPAPARAPMTCKRCRRSRNR